MSTNILLALRLWIISEQIRTFANSNAITCSADGLCRGKPVICNDNEDCRITCEGKDSCWYSIIQCPIHGTCNVWCGVERNSCDAITINATQSTSLYMYCADNECDDATIHCPSKHYHTNHLCTLEGAKTLDRVTFYTKEGFSDINIENIALLASKVICGDNAQYKCTINDAETGCINDNTCETYRLPTQSPTPSPTVRPTIPPTDIPTISPTISPTIHPTIDPTDAPTAAPTMAPSQAYDNVAELLEFYIYYNDVNGVNMILAKWMKEQFLITYDQYTGTSHNYTAGVYNANTKWKIGGLLNLTFCVVFNTNYRDNGDSQKCLRFKEYGVDLNDPTSFSTEYVAYGTFGIVSDQSIDSFQTYVIDAMTSILFRQVFNGNMVQRMKSVGFDDIFQAIAIKVKPFANERIPRNSISVNQMNNDTDLNIALGILLGILAALTCIVSVYCVRYYICSRLKTAKKNEKPKIKEGGHRYHNATETYADPITAEQMNLKIVPRNSNTVTNASFYDHGLLSIKRNTINESIVNDDHPYQKDDKFMDPGYYLAELQKTYLSSDADTNTEQDEDDEKLQHEPSSDSNDKASVISSIISFGRRKSKSGRRKSNAKHKKHQSKPRKHKRSQTAEIDKKQKKKKPKRKRSLHWGFTNDGNDIRYNQGENGIHRVSTQSTENSDAHSYSVNHLKSQSAFAGAGHCRHDALDIRQLEVLRKSSYHSYNPYLQFSNSYNSNIFQSPQPFSLNGMLFNDNAMQFNDSTMQINDDAMNNEEFLARLSPSMKSIEEMYASPASPDGEQNCTAQSTASAVNLNILQETASPVGNDSKSQQSQTFKDEAQNENNDVELNDAQTDGDDLQTTNQDQKQ